MAPHTPEPVPWKPSARHVLGLVLAFFASIVVLRPWLNGASDASFVASAAWLLFVALVTLRVAMLSVR